MNKIDGPGMRDGPYAVNNGDDEGEAQREALYNVALFLRKWDDGELSDDSVMEKIQEEIKNWR